MAEIGRTSSLPQGALVWGTGILLLGVPYLLQPDRPRVEYDDFTRSEDDIPFAEQVAFVDEELELGVAEYLAQATEEWFAKDSSALRESGIVELERLDAGRTVYEQECSGCHGVEGDGGGPAAAYLEPRPRNFRIGKFKFTSTPTGAKPRREDILGIVTNGLAGASMPAFRLLSEEKRRDVVEYVRWLAMVGEYEQLLLDIAYDEEELPDAAEWAEVVYERWSPRKLRPSYPPIPEPDPTAEAVERGAKLFGVEGANCAACHGPGGKGDGPSAEEFKDEWGYPIRPRDLTTGVYRVGQEPADLYGSIATGINGTPMPSYSGAFTPEEIWDLVHYILSLAEPGGAE